MALHRGSFTVASAVVLAVMSAAAVAQVIEVGDNGAAKMLGGPDRIGAHTQIARRWDGPLGKAVAAAATRYDLTPEVQRIRGAGERRITDLRLLSP